MFSALLYTTVPFHGTVFYCGLDTNDEAITLTVLATTSTQLPVAIWSVYCLKCWLITALSVFTVVELIPALLTDPSGLQASASQPLVSTQLVAVFGSWPASNKLKLPSLLSLPSAGKKNAWTECTWFISNVLYLHLWISIFSFTVSY